MLVVSALPGAGSSLLAQANQNKTMVVLLPPAPLLPERIGAWQRIGDLEEQNDILKVDRPGAKVFHEDGATRFASASYQPAAGGAVVKIDALQFEDASGAYSAFTFWAAQARRSMIIRQDGEEVAIPGQGLLFRSGTVIAVIEGSNESLSAFRSAAKDLKLVLPKVGGPRAQLPMAPTLLPEKGLEVGTVRYALGPEGYAAMGGLLPPGILGFDKSGEIVTAEYAGRGGKGVLTLLLYPTPQIAGDCGRAVEAAINADRSRFGTTVKLRREGPLVVLATGEFSTAEAQKLVEGTYLHDQLSWNKDMPLDFNSEVHKTLSLLEGIVLFCIVGGAAALLLGLFLGFGRAGIRVLMGKPAAMEPEFLRIDLRGEMARLKPADTDRQS